MASFVSSRAGPPAPRDGAAHARALERSLARYDKSLRRRLRKLVKATRRVGDLLTSYPAAAAALAANFGPYQRRRDALALVREGAGLKRVGDALGLPVWTRRLPPEAFRETLPEALARADDDAFGRKVANALPNKAAASALWLDWVLEAREACDDRFALWIAKAVADNGIGLEGDAPEAAAIAPLAAHAWTSRFGVGPAHAHIVDGEQWRATRTFYAAALSVLGWIDRLTAAEFTASGRGVSSASWRISQVVDGYTFTPLVTRAALEREGHDMRHCVASYWSDVALGYCLIYSVRRGGRSVATMEIRPQGDRLGRGRITQLYAKANAEPPASVRQAAEQWLRARRRCPCAVRGVDARSIDRDAWERTWAPYWEAKGERGPLRRDVSPQVANALQRSVYRLVALG